MMLGRRPASARGLVLDLETGALAPDQMLFSETGGFLLELEPGWSAILRRLPSWRGL